MSSKAVNVFVINVFPLVTKLGVGCGGGMEETADAQWVKSPLVCQLTEYAMAANVLQ